MESSAHNNEGGHKPEPDTARKGEKPPTAAVAGQQRPFRWLRRYRIALLLLVLFGIFTGVAAATFPRPAPVYRPDSFGVAATLNGDLKDVTVRVLPRGGDYYNVSILLISGPPPISKYSQDGIVELFLAPGTRVIGCKHVPGPSRGQQCFGPVPGAVSGGTKLLLMTHAFSPYPSNHNFWTATLDTTLVANHFAFDSNGLDAEAVLPSAYAFSSDPSYSHASVTQYLTTTGYQTLPATTGLVNHCPILQPQAISSGSNTYPPGDAQHLIAILGLLLRVSTMRPKRMLTCYRLLPVRASESLAEP